MPCAHQRSGNWRAVAGAAKAVGSGAVEWLAGVLIVKHVPRTVPTPAQEESLPIACLVPTPLLDIARHVERAEWSDALEMAAARRSRAPEVADRNCPWTCPEIGRAVPVVKRRELFSGKLSKGRSLIPGDPGDRKLLLPFLIIACIPSGGAGPAGGIAKLVHRIFPGEGPVPIDECLLPILLLSITTAIHECLELLVRDFVSVDEIMFQTG